MQEFVLIYFDTEEGERRFPLEEGRSYRLGAKSDNDIVIERPDVSRQHAILRVGRGVFHITDLKSKNGTFINGNPTDEAEFRPGDLLGLSSARMIVVEKGSAEFSVDSGDRHPSRSGDTSKTVEFQHRIGAEDLVELFEITAHAIRNRSVAEPLGWAERVLGVEGSLVLYRDDSGKVSVVSSAGDLAPLMGRGRSLKELISYVGNRDRKATRIKRFPEIGEDVLVAPITDEYCLIIRYGGSAPAVGDVRALVFAMEIVLFEETQDGDGPETAPLQTAGGAPPRPEQLLEKPLSQAREDFERWFVSTVLDQCGDNVSEAARRLGLSRAGLFKKLKKFGLKA